MNETEVAEWVKLLQVGGNAGIIVLTIIASKVAAAFLSALRGIRDDAAKHHAEVLAGQEDIKRSLVALNPASEQMFRKRGS